MNFLIIILLGAILRTPSNTARVCDRGLAPNGQCQTCKDGKTADDCSKYNEEWEKQNKGKLK